VPLLVGPATRRLPSNGLGSDALIRPRERDLASWITLTTLRAASRQTCCGLLTRIQSPAAVWWPDCASRRGVGALLLAGKAPGYSKRRVSRCRGAYWRGCGIEESGFA